MSKHTVTIACPACQQPLEANVTIIEDEEGDSSIPNGTHRFLTVDDYAIDWKHHHVMLVAASAQNDDVIVPLIPCDDQLAEPVTETTQWGDRYDTWPLMDTLLDRLLDWGAKAEREQEPSEVDDMSMSNFDR